MRSDAVYCGVSLIGARQVKSIYIPVSSNNVALINLLASCNI